MRYVPTSAGSPVKSALPRALGIKNSVLNNPPGKTTIYRKVQDRSKSEPFYKELKEEIVRESDHTITLKNGKIIRKSDLAIKTQSALKRPSPRKKNQLVKFYATKGLRKTTRPQRNVGFESSRATQKKRNLQAKFEELEIARQNAAMNNSRETPLREEEEQRKRLRFPIGLESDHESSPLGKPDHLRICDNEYRATNNSTEISSDDNASDLISLKELKTKTVTNPEKSLEYSSPDQADLKAEITDQTDPKVESTELPLIDFDAEDNNTTSHSNPPLTFLDSHEEADKGNKERPNSFENPSTEQTEKIADPITIAETEKQQPEVSSTKTTAKMSGTAKRKASSPVKSPPSKKLPGIYERHNTRPMRVRQPPKMLGEIVFTSVVDISDENLDVPTLHQFHTPPYYPTIEATSIEMESHQIDVVDSRTPTSPSTPDPTSVDLLEESFGNSSGISNSIANPRKKVKFSPEVHTTRFHPSDLPSETTESVSNPIVLDPDWLNFPSIISAIELLGRPMTFDELRRWKINRAANRDAI